MLLDPAGARVAPVDCEAVVRANARLSADYHVLTLDAPDVAARTQPGQFVMVKPGRGLDPLLRRPFSVFQILRDAAGAETGVSALSAEKPIAAVTPESGTGTTTSASVGL